MHIPNKEYFIRIDNDKIINTLCISSIERIPVKNELYTYWYDTFNKLMQDVSVEYMKTHVDTLEGDESDIADELYEKFNIVVRKNVERELGKCPEPYTYTYIIRMNNDQTIDIDDSIYAEICNILKIDMGVEMIETIEDDLIN